MAEHTQAVATLRQLHPQQMLRYGAFKHALLSTYAS